MLRRNEQPAQSTNGSTGPALMHYEVNGVPLSLYADGSLWLGSHKLEQQTVFALAVGLSLPGVKVTINRIERTRQAAETLDDGSEQIHDRR